MAANIPWIALNVPRLRRCLEEHIGLSVPDESTVRKTLDDVNQDVSDAIKSDLKGSPLWLGVDETIDAKGRYVANVIIGKLNNEGFHQPYLVNCTFLEKANTSTISRLVSDTLRSLWPDFDANLLRVLLSDTAPYMMKSGREL